MIRSQFNIQLVPLPSPLPGFNVKIIIDLHSFEAADRVENDHVLIEKFTRCRFKPDPFNQVPFKKSGTL